MKRAVMVKESINETGVGSIPATLIWESDPGEYGEFAHIARGSDGRMWLSIVDMEEADGSYVSVEISPYDISALVRLAELHPADWSPPNDTESGWWPPLSGERDECGEVTE